ncbi:MAG: hypothetical protein JW841_12170 [Deltaproteobacteria bacterium]|nr:hypothetical protein [Deltaproteobacteria bacterium]
MASRFTFIFIILVTNSCTNRSKKNDASDTNPDLSALCNNNIKEANEICDGTDLGNATCANQGFTTGQLFCASDCKSFDYSNCVGRTLGCGNHIIDGYESCDGDIFLNGITTCEAAGLGVGMLKCNDRCEIDYSGCAKAKTSCGSQGNTANLCDPCDLWGGPLDPDCITWCGADSIVCADYFDYTNRVWTCEHTMQMRDPDCGICNNGILENHELCDGDNIGKGKCSDWGYTGGILACRHDCAYDFSNCTFDECHDGIIGVTEICDGDQLSDQTCQSLGYNAGELKCQNDCLAFDTTACTTTAICPDDIVSGPETCDTLNMNSETCVSLGFNAGTLACASDCMSFNVSNCHGISTCGNGHRDPKEYCEGDEFGPWGILCISLGLGSGTLTCNIDCTVNTSTCNAADPCAATRYANGLCDVCDIIGGKPDPECLSLCTANGVCANRFDFNTNRWTCTHAGLVDPDCGTCGNGIIEINELCDGNRFAHGKDTCMAYGYLGGTLSCRPDCVPNFNACIHTN